MKSEQTGKASDEQLMRLSSRITYGAIIKDDKEVEITREMMKKACKNMESLQMYPFSNDKKD